MQLPSHHPGSVLYPFVAVAFWTLTVISVFGLNGVFPNGSNADLLVVALGFISSLVLVGLVHVRLSQALGGPGVLILATIVSHLLIGFTVSVVTAVEMRGDVYGNVKDHAISLTVISAAALGGRAILERLGVEAFLKSMLMILMASSTTVLLSPILPSMGDPLNVGDSFRLTGTHVNPNYAGFAGCMTAVLALAFLCNVRRHLLGYLGLTAGSFAIFASFSKTAVISLALISIFFLLFNGRGSRVSVLLCLGAVTLSGVIALQFLILKGTPLHLGQLKRTAHVVQLMSGGGIDDEVLTQRRTLWKLGQRLALESPIVGNGLSQLRHMHGGRMAHDGAWLGVHNLYLLLLGEAGVVPFSLYLLHLFSLLRLNWTAPKTLVRDVVVGWTMTVALVSGTMDHVWAVELHACLIGLTCAMAATLKEGAMERPDGSAAVKPKRRYPHLAADVLATNSPNGP